MFMKKSVEVVRFMFVFNLLIKVETFRWEPDVHFFRENFFKQETSAIDNSDGRWRLFVPQCLSLNLCLRLGDYAQAKAYGTRRKGSRSLQYILNKWCLILNFYSNTTPNHPLFCVASIGSKLLAVQQRWWPTDNPWQAAVQQRKDENCCKIVQLLLQCWKCEWRHSLFGRLMIRKRKCRRWRRSLWKIFANRW